MGSSYVAGTDSTSTDWRNRQLAGAIDDATVRELVGETSRVEAPADVLEVTGMRTRQISGRFEPDLRRTSPSAEALVRIGEDVQSLLWRDASEVTNPKHIVGRGGGARSRSY